MYRWSFVIIQWPAHVCHPYVVHSNLLWNSQSNFNQTSRKCSLRWPSSKLAQRFNFIYTFHGIYQRVQCKAIVTSSFTFFYRRRGKKCFVIPQKNSFGGYKGVTVPVWSHILSGLFLTNHWVELNKTLHEASILRGDVHTLKVLQLHVILQSYGPFTY